MGSSAPVRVAAVMLAAFVSACSSSSKPASSASSGPHSSTTVLTRPLPGSFDELAARIVTRVPAGFVPQPDRVGDTGPSDLAKAIRDDGSPDAGNAFRTEGFVRGYQRLWIGPDNAQIIVFVYQFTSQAGAHLDYVRATHRYDTKPPPGFKAHKFAVAGPLAGRAIGIVGVGTDAAAAIIYFTSGPFNLQIDCNGPTVADLAALQRRVTTIALDQLSRL